MKHYLRLFILVLTSFFSTSSLLAYDFEVDGIYYNVLSLEDLTCEVTYKDTNYKSYSGEIIIPSNVTYSNKTYSVTSIGLRAFSGCSSLTSIDIPNSVAYIGYGAFRDCTGLT